MPHSSGPVETARFSVIQFLFWASIVSFEVFMVPYLTDAGYSPSQVGFIMSAIFGFAILGQPILGSLSDKRNSPRIIVAVAMTLAATGAVLIPGSVHRYGVLIAIALLYSLTANSLPAVMDAWIMARRRHNPGLSYGVARGFGSMGYALAALTIGRVAQRFGIQIVFPTFAVFAMVVVLLSLLMPRPSQGDPAGRSDRKGGRSHLTAGLRAAATNGPYLTLLAATFITFVGFRAGLTFLPLLLSSVGGTVSDVGLASSIAGLSEVPFLFLSGLLVRRVRGPWLIAGVMALMAVRLFAYSFIQTSQATLLLQVSHGVTFGIFLAALVNYIDVIAPRDHRSLFQAIGASVFFGLGSVVGSWLGGVAIERFSLILFYRGTAVVALVGAAIMFLGGVVPRSGMSPQARVDGPDNSM